MHNPEHHTKAVISVESLDMGQYAAESKAVKSYVSISLNGEREPVQRGVAPETGAPVSEERPNDFWSHSEHPLDASEDWWPGRLHQQSR